MLVGLTPAEAGAVKDRCLAAYADRLNLTEGRVSAEYRRSVCLNLLKDFWARHGI